MTGKPDIEDNIAPMQTRSSNSTRKGLKALQVSTNTYKDKNSKSLKKQSNVSSLDEDIIKKDLIKIDDDLLKSNKKVGRVTRNSSKVKENPDSLNRTNSEKVISLNKKNKNIRSKTLQIDDSLKDNTIYKEQNINDTSKNKKKTKTNNSEIKIVNLDKQSNCNAKQIKSDRVKLWLTTKGDVDDAEYWRLRYEQLIKENEEIEKLMEDERKSYIEQLKETELENELLKAENEELTKLVNEAMKLRTILEDLGIEC